MATRRRAREVALQLIYENDFGTERGTESRQEFIESRLRDRKPLQAFSLAILDGVLEHREAIDRMIATYATNWTLTRMAAIDRNILRIGCYEIAFGETPNSVAINEAIELAKRYGDRNSSRFVNGILDRVGKMQPQTG